MRVEGDIAVVGITDFAQHALGDIVFAELPAVGGRVNKGKGAAVVESVKSVSDVYSPVCGEVAEANNQVSESPEVINKSPYTDGWMFKVKIEDKSELNDLMDSASYARYAGAKK